MGELLVMALRVEVDQSGKVEQSNRSTVLAYSNSHRYTVEILATTKQDALRRLREQGRSSRAAVQLVFVALLALLLKDVIEQADAIMIDTEYTGQEAAIKSQLLMYLDRMRVRFDPNLVQFGQIGKRSPAHELAIGVTRGKVRANRRIAMDELWTVLTK